MYYSIGYEGALFEMPYAILETSKSYSVVFHLLCTFSLLIVALVYGTASTIKEKLYACCEDHQAPFDNGLDL